VLRSAQGWPFVTELTSRIVSARDIIPPLGGARVSSYCVRAVPRVHLFPADFTVRQTVILGHGFVVPNFIYYPAVGAFKSFRHLKNILWLGVGF